MGRSNFFSNNNGINPSSMSSVVQPLDEQSSLITQAPKNCCNPHEALTNFGAVWEFLGIIAVMCFNMLTFFQRIFSITSPATIGYVAIPTIIGSTIISSSSAYIHRIKLRQLHMNQMSSSNDIEQLTDEDNNLTGCTGMLRQEWSSINNLQNSYKALFLIHFFNHLAEESAFFLTPLSALMFSEAIEIPETIYFALVGTILLLASLPAANESIACLRTLTNHLERQVDTLSQNNESNTMSNSSLSSV